jgi:hypothetical protein
MGNPRLTAMMSHARTAYIEWLLKGDTTTAANLANALSHLADYLDCTESQALAKVQGNE